jgi:hypothetical protein
MICCPIPSPAAPPPMTTTEQGMSFAGESLEHPEKDEVKDINPAADAIFKKVLREISFWFIFVFPVF